MGPVGSGLGSGDIFPLGAKDDCWAAISRLRVVLIFRLSHVGGQNQGSVKAMKILHKLGS